RRFLAVGATTATATATTTAARCRGLAGSLLRRRFAAGDRGVFGRPGGLLKGGGRGHRGDGFLAERFIVALAATTTAAAPATIAFGGLALCGGLCALGAVGVATAVVVAAP